MTKLTNNYTIRFSVQQAESLQKLKDYDVNISQFIRLACGNLATKTQFRQQKYEQSKKLH